MLIRLNKYLKDQGICSRRKADDFILKGYIQVNNNVITELGYKLNPEVDKVLVNQDLKQEIADFSYILLNKPLGYVCSKSDMDGKNIFSLIPNIAGLTYAGRLDKDSSGLIILSNDGKFVYHIAGSEFGCEKEYLVQVDKPLTDNYLKKQADGTIKLGDKQVKPAKIQKISHDTYKIVLTQGINRQIRRMAENQGYKVISLKRIRVGNISDTNLPVGKWRNLTPAEIKILFS